MNFDPETLAAAVRTLISLMGIWLIAFWLYPDYRVDAFRQNLFSIRDRLFDAAAEGEISFDHPAYGLLRRTINGFMRFGHELTGFRLLILSLVAGRVEPPPPSFQEEWDAKIRSLDTDVIDRLEKIRERMEIEALAHVLFRSRIVFPLTVVPLSVLAVVFVAVKGGRHFFTRLLSRDASMGAARQTLQRVSLARLAVDRMDSLAMENG